MIGVRGDYHELFDVYHDFPSHGYRPPGLLIRRNTLVEFSAKHMMFTTVKGRFTGVSGTIRDVADEPSRSSVQVGA